jgi:lysophospholipase L1-like esterase
MRPFRPMRAVITAATAGATLLTVAGIGPAAATDAGTPRQMWQRTSVYVEGDSLTVGTAAPLRSMLGRKLRALGIDAQIGRNTGTGLSRLGGDPRARRADIWVVALGTNDGPDPHALARYVQRSMRMAGDREVIWVTLRRPGGYGRVNTMLRTLDRRRERMHLVDWARRTQSRGGLIAGDGVHGTSTGYRMRARWIAAATLTAARERAARDSARAGSGGGRSTSRGEPPNATGPALTPR